MGVGNINKPREILTYFLFYDIIIIVNEKEVE